VFDVETVFLFPWAVKYGVMTRQFGLAALAAVFIFLIVVTFAYAYAWRKQDLEWVTNDDRS
jgi:NADH-quinone oxidoreductase subunit A